MSASSQEGKVEVRKVWTHEAHDFTPWLAKNLHLLADELLSGHVAAGEIRFGGICHGATLAGSIPYF